MTDADKFVEAVKGRMEGKSSAGHCDRHQCDFEIFNRPNGEAYTNCPVCDKAEKEIKKRDEWNHLNSKSNIEPMYHNATIKNFETPTDELKKAKANVQTLIQSRTGKLVMIGANGTGKTHLAVAAVRELKGKIFTMYEITTRIRASYTAKAKETELQIVDNLARLPMLAIDEIGRTKGSDAETNWLSYIIDKRHSRGLPLILITNKHTRKTCTAKGCPDCLENYIGNDIMSRLNEDGFVIRFSGDDWRKKKRANA